jgi:hypothetical protein
MINQDKLWQEGKYPDFWSIPHIIVGALFMWIFEFFSLNIFLNFALSLFFIIGWEFFELYVLKVHEHLTNKVTDVITGIIGFFIMYYFILKQGLMNLLIWQIGLSIIYLAMCLWGFWHHYTRKRLKLKHEKRK